MTRIVLRNDLWEVTLMEPTCGTGLDSGTSLEELTSSLAEEEIERISELSADA